MEEEKKPQIISTIDYLSKNYSKLIKYQREKLNCALSGKEFEYKIKAKVNPSYRINYFSSSIE